MPQQFKSADPDLTRDVIPPTIDTRFPKLDRVKQQIRLLRVSADASLEWVISDVHQTPNYYTLSYAWDEVTDVAGSPSIRIKHNNKISTRPVQYNLWTFLMHPESWLSDVTYLWIDSLCIDQSNLEELNHQVGFMDKIYASCEGVLVWLGEPGTKIAQHWTRIKSGQPLNLWLQTMRTGPEADKRIFDDIIKDLMARSYWSRMWTVQEFVIPPFVRICIGSHSLTLNDLLDLLCFYRTSHQGDDFWKWHECTLQDSHGTYVPKLFNSMCERRSSHWWNPDSYRVPGNQRAWEPTFASIAPSRRCTNPRDYIYATLGMCAESGIIPDYKSPMADILIYILLNVNLRQPIQTGQTIYQLFGLSVPTLHRRHKHDPSSFLYSSPKMWHCLLIPLGEFSATKCDDRFTYFDSKYHEWKLITSAPCDFDPHLTELFRIADTYIGIILRWYFVKGDDTKPRVQVLVGYCSTQYYDLELCRPLFSEIEQAFLGSTVRFKDDFSGPRMMEHIPGPELELCVNLDAFAFILDMSEFARGRFDGSEWQWFHQKAMQMTSYLGGRRGDRVEMVLPCPPHFVGLEGCPCEFGRFKGHHRQPLSEIMKEQGRYWKYLLSGEDSPRAPSLEGFGRRHSE